MQGRKHQIAHLQSDFFRDQFRKIWRWIIYSLVLMFLLLAGILYFLLFEPSVRYFANTADGRVLNMPTPISGGE